MAVIIIFKDSIFPDGAKEWKFWDKISGMCYCCASTSTWQCLFVSMGSTDSLERIQWRLMTRVKKISIQRKQCTKTLLNEVLNRITFLYLNCFYDPSHSHSDIISQCNAMKSVNRHNAFALSLKLAFFSNREFNTCIIFYRISSYRRGVVFIINLF